MVELTSKNLLLIIVIAIVLTISLAAFFLLLRPPEETPQPPLPTPPPEHGEKPGPKSPGREHGPVEGDKYFYVVVWIPCKCAGDKGIATLVIYPKQPRYKEGAPVVVTSQGGHTPGSIKLPEPDFDPYGVVWVEFLFPGGRSGEFESGGFFDHGGRACTEALYSVLQYAQGKIANTAGKKITDYASYPILTDNVGVIGNSNGGNIAGVTFARYKSGLEGVKYVIFYETPAGDHYVVGDLGRKGDDPDPRVDADGDGIPWDDARNLKYVEGSCTETSCTIDFSTLDYDPQVGFYLDNNGDGKANYVGRYPRVRTDVDGSGALEPDEDFIFMSLHVKTKEGEKTVYSYLVTKAAWDKGLFSKVSEKVMKPEEASNFWLEREICYHYDEISQNMPWLKVMQLGFMEDHVQATRDHPHIVINYNAFKKRGHWVRLNPDKSYIEQLAGARPGIAENPANIELTFDNIVQHLLLFRNVKLVIQAAVLEMADRVQFNEWSDDLSGVLLGGAASTPTCRYEIEVVEGRLVEAPNGNKLYVRIYQPKTSLYDVKFPAVIFVAGGRGDAIVADAWSQKRLLGVAEYGIVEVYFNPQGVGPPPYRSEGTPDFGGFRQQDDLMSVILYVKSLPNVDPNNIGVVSFSFGIATAAGCLGRHPELDVKYLIDIEGPSHSVIAAMDYGTEEQQENFYKSFGHWSLAKDPSPENEAWWREREAYRYIGNFTGAYLRIQGEIDHIQPRGIYEHALIMNNEAVKGKPWWVRIGLAEQGNPVNKIYPLDDPSKWPKWIPGRLKDKWDAVVAKAVLEMVKMFGGQVCDFKESGGKISVHDVDVLENGHLLLTLFTVGGGPSKVVELDENGDIVWSFEDLNFAHGAEIRNDMVLISDTGNDRVIIVDKNTKQIIWSTDEITLSDGSKLKYPNDADFIDDNRILITDRDNHRVIEIDLNGNILWQFGETGVPGNDLSHLKFPHNADRLPNGNTIICDSENNRILEVDSSGRVVWIFEGGLNWPRDADRLPNGNTLIVDSRNGRVIEVSPEGSIVWSFTGLRLPYDADLLSDGKILISDSGRSRILIVDRSEAVIWELSVTSLK